MTSKNSVSLRSRAPRAALGGGLIAAVLLASGCQSRVGTAADVGSSRITTDDLNKATQTQAATAAGKAAGAGLERSVLSQLVVAQQVQELADLRGVHASAGDVASAAAQYKASATANNAGDEPASYWQQQGLETATATAIMADYAQKGGTVDAVKLYAVPVADQATGQKVLSLLKKDPSAGNRAALAQQYSTDAGLKAAGGEAGINRLSDLNVPALATMKKDDATLATVGSTLAVLVVEERLDTADFSSDLTKRVKVTVNPRFGTWGLDAANGGYAVLAASNGVSKPDPNASSPAASAVPSGSVTTAPSAGASAAPSAAASSGG